MDATSTRSPLTIRLCQPRGFCAGVDRAIQIVVLALKKYGAPVYVRHEIVHNRYVVEGLQNLGAVFIEELSEIPAGASRQPGGVFGAWRTEVGARGCTRTRSFFISTRHARWSPRCTSRRCGTSGSVAMCF